MSNKRHVLVDYADRTIRYSQCPLTGEDLISMRIPFHLDGKKRGMDWVTVLAEDFGRMLKHGLSSEWVKLDGGPVATPHPTSRYFIGIGCYLAGAGKTQNVDYLDGDCFNLRRNNLVIVPETWPWLLDGPYLQDGYQLSQPFARAETTLRLVPRRANRPVMQLPKETLRAIRKCFEEMSRPLLPREERAFPGLGRVSRKLSAGGRK